MVIFSGCGKANSAECPDLRTQEYSNGDAKLYIRARDDISIHNIIINRGNCLYVDKNGLYRNGIDKMLVGHYSKEPLTSDYIESKYDGEVKEIAYKELNAGPKKLVENIDLKFGEEKVVGVLCKPLEVVFETNLGQCEYKFD
ncbi:MAG: hypothetical protein MR964_04855 [Campylobacter sp.]|uniref:hypothetical protein n=1 Tax=Campylobacter sp. TaxID=205 RepID=UPI002AA61993|nr:hypothetical protein [Campylobacter sp.]MCI7023539.1 hypothetical protein [Campylobacter sp.]